MIDIIKNFFTSQWGGMISGLLTSAFIALLKLVSDYIATTKNEYSGVWVDAVYDKDGKIEKVDIWKLRYNNHTKKVKGRVKRYYGVGKDKEWKCVGQILGDKFYLIYEGLGCYSDHNGCATAKRILTCEYSDLFDMQANGQYIKIDDYGNVQSVKITFFKLSKGSLKLIKKEGMEAFLKNTELYKDNLK